jgi:glutamate-1-semialdehyde 2,1-aminomutase
MDGGLIVMDDFLERELKEYYRKTPKARKYYQTACRYLPGGTTRTLSFFQPYPLFIERGKGCTIWDVDGNERIDFFNNATSLILGHANPAVVKAVRERAKLGTAFHAPTMHEVELARLLCERIPSVERVRFMNSGTEAAMMAIRAAKAFTGKNKIGKMEGGYHGSADHAYVSVHPDLTQAGPADSPQSLSDSLGISPQTLSEVVVMPFNDAEAVERIVKREKDNLACIIVEPMMGAAGIIPAKKGFLQDLRRITRENDVLLIFDEVQTFRHSWGGAQGLHGVLPDLTALAKIIGGGFPSGAVGGKAEIMSVFDSSGGHAKVPHGGTFNGNPVTMAAGLATMKQLTRKSFAHLSRLGDELRRELTDLFVRYGYKARVTGETSFFKVHFTDQEVVDYRSARKGVNSGEERKIFFHLLNRGIFVESQIKGCLSVPMGRAEIHALLGAMEDYLKRQKAFPG